MVRKVNGSAFRGTRALRVAVKRRLRKEAQQAAADRVLMERYLDEQYLGTEVDGTLKPFNLPIIKASCLEFNPKNPLCRCCRFYSNRIQEQKLGRTCPIWDKVFGKDMKGQIERFAIDGIRVDAKFIQIWRARKVNVPQPPRREATLSYDHPAPHVKKDAYPGLPAVQM